MKGLLVESALQDVSRIPVEALMRIADALGLEVTLQPPETKHYVGNVPSVVDVVLQKLAPESLVYVPASPWALVLRWEGVLIGDAARGLARPGLFRFLNCCRPLVSRLVVSTVVEEAHFRELARRLASEGSVPAWFAEVEYARSWGGMAELTLIPRADSRFTLVVADMRHHADSGPQLQCINISSFEAPFDSSDRELDRVLDEIARRTTSGL